MAVERIDSLYDVPAIQAEQAAVVKALADSQEAINKLYDNLGKYKGSNLINFGAQLAELDKSIASAAANIAKLTAADANLAKAALLAAKAETEKAKATTEANKASTEAAKKTVQEEKAKQELLKTGRLTTTEAERQAKAQAKAAAEAAKAVNAYELLKKSYTAAAEESKRLGAEMLLQNADLAKLQPLYENATKEANEYYEQLIKLEKAVGQSQRAVGQYENATRGLNNSVQQIARELPALGVNLNTFFLAISNNLPIFFDEIAKIRESNAELIKSQQEVANAAGTQATASALLAGATQEAADKIGELAKEQALAAVEGNKGTNVFKAITSSIFSVGTALTIGVTLLTVFGGKLIEMVTALFNSEAALKRQREATIANNKAYQDLINLTNEFNEATARNPRLDTLQAETEYLRALNVERTQQLEAEVELNIERVAAAKKTSDEIIAEQGRAGSFEATYRLAEAGLTTHIRKMAALRKADKYNNDDDLKEADEQELAALQSQFDLAKFNFDRLKAAEKENTDSSIAFATKKYEQQTYLDQLTREAAERNTTIRAQAEIDANDRILNNQLSTEGQIISSVNNIAREQKRIAAARLASVLGDPSTEASQAASARLDYSKQIEKIEEDSQKKIFDIRQDWANRTLRANKQTEDIRLNDIIATNNEVVDNEINTANERILAANKINEAQIKLVEDDYNLQKALLDQKAAADGEYEALEVDKNSKLAALATDGAKRLLDIQESLFKTSLDRQQKQIQDIVRQQALANLSTSKTLSDSVLASGAAFKQGKIDFDDYQSQIETAQAQAALEKLEVELRTQKEILDAFGDTEAAIKDLLTKRAEVQQELSNATDQNTRNELAAQLASYNKDLEQYQQINDSKIKAQEEFNKIAADLEIARLEFEEKARIASLNRLGKKIQQYGEIVGNILGAISEIANIGFDKQQAAVDELNAKQEKAYEDEVKRISQLNLSDAERADKLKVLEAQRLAQQTENERKLRKIAVERARFEKASNIANIITSTALAVVNALKTSGPIGIALAAAVGALGAAQLARAIATPLPSYRKGTDYHQGGAALVHPGELVVEPGKAPYMTPNAPETLIPNLAKGAKVITANEVNEMMHHDMLRRTAANLMIVNNQKSDKSMQEIRDAVRHQTAVLSKAIGKSGKRGVVNVNASGKWGEYLERRIFN